MKNTLQYSAVIKTPVSTLGVFVEEGVLLRVDYLDSKTPEVFSTDRITKAACQQIERYCEHRNYEIDVNFEAAGTAFQKKVWKKIEKIPYGSTRSYGEIAKQLKTSPRAVGNACRVNPLILVIPCHRVVSAQGIGGYSGKISGNMISTKEWLLEHENPSK